MKRHIRLLSWQALALVLSAIVFAPAQADPPKKDKPAEKTVIYPTGYLRHDDWMKASTAPLTAGELDRLVTGQLKTANVEPAKLTSDEQFIRRAWLDLTGRLPMPADVKEFVADKNPKKRSQLIDKLLDTDDYARHWGLYWRDVIMSKIVDQRVNLFTPHFEKWIVEQLKANRRWSEITRDLLTATGEVRNAEIDKNG